MPAASDPQPALAALNATAPFNRWAAFEVACDAPGRVELSLPWRPELGQYAGFLHAGLIGAMIDTACGFAAFTLVGHVLASHFSVNCLASASGESYLARGRVVKAGRRQVFAAAELFACTAGKEKLVATGEAILVPVGVAAPA
jgi:acyl-coenzyme A thioesterase PaaI-like protein